MCIFQNLEPLKIFQYFFVSLKKKINQAKKKNKPKPQINNLIWKLLFSI